MNIQIRLETNHIKGYGIWLQKDANKLFFGNYKPMNDLIDHYLPHLNDCEAKYIYIINDDTNLVEGDWVLSSGGHPSKLCESIHGGLYLKGLGEKYTEDLRVCLRLKKIIATNDPDVDVYQLPHEYIDKYIIAYNAGTPFIGCEKEHLLLLS